MPLILASASPRRHQLLGVFGIDFDIRPAQIDETPGGGEAPVDYTERMAVEKACSVAAICPDCFVLGSDTTVAIGADILGKPANAAEAETMLHRLSGTRHSVLSAVALCAPGGGVEALVNQTWVEFAVLPEAWIRQYVASGEPMDKAGAYGIQGVAGIWVKQIEGSHTGVMGLPLYETGELLRRSGLV